MKASSCRCGSIVYRSISRILDRYANECLIEHLHVSLSLSLWTISYSIERLKRRRLHPSIPPPGGECLHFLSILLDEVLCCVCLLCLLVSPLCLFVSLCVSFVGGRLSHWLWGFLPDLSLLPPLAPRSLLVRFWGPRKNERGRLLVDLSS